MDPARNEANVSLTLDQQLLIAAAPTLQSTVSAIYTDFVNSCAALTSETNPTVIKSNYFTQLTEADSRMESFERFILSKVDLAVEATKKEDELMVELLDFVNGRIQMMVNANLLNKDVNLNTLQSVKGRPLVVKLATEFDAQDPRIVDLFNKCAEQEKAAAV